MLEQQKMAQTVINMTKGYTTANMTVMKTTMEQFEKTMDVLLEHGTVVQDEGTKLFVDWWGRAKQGQQQYWNMMEDGLKNMENLFGNANGQKKATK